MKIAVMCTLCERLLFLEQDVEQWRELQLRLPSSCPERCNYSALVIKIEPGEQEQAEEEEGQIDVTRTD